MGGHDLRNYLALLLYTTNNHYTVVKVEDYVGKSEGNTKEFPEELATVMTRSDDRGSWSTAW